MAPLWQLQLLQMWVDFSIVTNQIDEQWKEGHKTNHFLHGIGEGQFFCLRSKKTSFKQLAIHLHSDLFLLSN